MACRAGKALAQEGEVRDAHNSAKLRIRELMTHSSALWDLNPNDHAYAGENVELVAQK
ncbi:MAG: hypothetical protein KAV87_23920 [Desulfobacteraceae bacterium]|nr:hypothetical protein [Desulfobacteraceae bacterium]